MQLIVDNTFVHVRNETFEMRSAIWNALSYKVKAAHIIMRRSGMKDWDGMRSFYNASEQTFYSGFLGHVLHELHNAGIDCEVIDARKKPEFKLCQNFLKLGSIVLRDYQEAAVRSALDAFRGVLQLATGAGKTECAAAIIKATALPTLFLTHRVELLRQTVARFKKRLPAMATEIGMIGDGVFKPKHITVATVQTLHSLLKRNPGKVTPVLGQAGLLILDEAHRAGATQFQAAAQLCVNAYFRFGLTATPFMRDDPAGDMPLMGITGPVIAKVTPGELIGRGILARPFFKFYDVKSPVNIGHMKNWRDVYEQGIVNNQWRNLLIARQVHAMAAKGKKPLVIVQEVKHGYNVMAELDKLAVHAVFVKGEDEYGFRCAQMDKLATGEVGCVVATNIFDEGVDVPELDMVVMAGGGKSIPALLQRTGRSIRPKDDGSHAIVVDFIDYQHSILKRHSIERYEAVKAEKGFTIV